MTKPQPAEPSNRCPRRTFLAATAATAAATSLVTPLSIARGAHAAGSDVLKFALVGAGGRGRGAATNVLRTKANTKLVAIADAFEESVTGGLAHIVKRCPEGVDIPDDQKFSGLDAYEKVLACDIDLVLLCTPPGFRPMQFEAAVKAGKHVFMEKPLATDAPGLRRVIAANEEAKKKGLAVAVGHHLRHESKHKDVIQKIHDGAIGDITSLRIYYLSNGVWVRPRKPDQTEMQYQVKNWYYFTWLGGDHILEQHVHDIDVGNWIKQAHPIRAQGIGGRQVRIGKDYGEIFDHHAVEFEYADGARMYSYCRHIPGCWDSFSEHAQGTKGTVDIEGHGSATLFANGQEPVKFERGQDGYQIEMNELVDAIRTGKPYNECDRSVDATMTAMLGRMASYTGKVVQWDEALASNIDLTPERMAWDAEPKSKAGPDGLYPCAVPGMTKCW